MATTQLISDRTRLTRRVGIAVTAVAVFALIVWGGLALQPKPAIVIDTDEASVTIGPGGISVETESPAN